MNTIQVKQYSQPRDESVYEDVLAHCSRPNRGDGRYTDAHETSHFISSEIRNAHAGHNNGFYLLGGAGVVVDHPSITIGDIAGYIPPTLRGFRYQLYLVTQRRYWDDEPLYIMEELNCYTIGGMTAVDDADAGRSLERTDAVAGAFEFTIYTLGLAMAVRDKDSAYWDSNTQFREFLSYLLGKAMHTFKAGKDRPEFQSIKSSELQQAYATTADGKRFDALLKELVTPPAPPQPEVIDWRLNLEHGR